VVLVTVTTEVVTRPESTVEAAAGSVVDVVELVVAVVPVVDGVAVVDGVVGLVDGAVMVVVVRVDAVAGVDVAGVDVVGVEAVGVDVAAEGADVDVADPAGRVVLVDTPDWMASSVTYRPVWPA
jgi:hypothetical protein